MGRGVRNGRIGNRMASRGPGRSPVLDGTADVRSLMTRELVLAGPDERAAALLERMNRGRFHHVLVVTPDALERERAPFDRVPAEAIAGIVSAQDLLEQLRDLPLPEVCELQAREVMSPAPLITVSASTSLKQALETLCDCSISALPVLEHGYLVGVVTTEDVLTAVALARKQSVTGSQNT